MSAHRLAAIPAKWTVEGDRIKAGPWTVAQVVHLGSAAMTEKHARMIAAAPAMAELLAVVAELTPSQYPEAAAILARIKGEA